MINAKPSVCLSLWNGCSSSTSRSFCIDSNRDVHGNGIPNGTGNPMGMGISQKIGNGDWIDGNGGNGNVESHSRTSLDSNDRCVTACLPSGSLTAGESQTYRYPQLCGVKWQVQLSVNPHNQLGQCTTSSPGPTAVKTRRLFHTGGRNYCQYSLHLYSRIWIWWIVVSPSWMARLSWSGWLVVQRDDLPASR